MGLIQMIENSIKNYKEFLKMSCFKICIIPEVKEHLAYPGAFFPSEA